MAHIKNGARSSFLSRFLAPTSTGLTAPKEASVHPDVQFEATDVSARGIALGGFILLLAIWTIVVLLHFVFALFSHYRAEVSPPPQPLAAELKRFPPAPQLQVSPRADLKDLRAYENSKLNHYTWVDRQKGIVGIPIERAMQILAARGIPAQKTPDDLKLVRPTAGTRMTGFEGKVEPEPR